MKKFLIGAAILIAVLFVIDKTILKEKGIAVKINEHEKYEKAKNPSELPIGLEKGERAPDFTLTDLKGNTVKLSDFKGKKVMLNFWASWCPPCKAEMPYMEQIYKKYKKEDIEIVAVNLTATEKKADDVTHFVEEYGLTFTIPLDEQGEVSAQYGVMAYPTSYFIDTDGVIRSKAIGAVSEDQMLKELLKLQ